MKPPQKCPCPVHATEDPSKLSQDPKLNRKVRRDCLERAQRWRSLIPLETDPKEKTYLESIAVCAEWTAWTCLLILREIRKDRP